MLEFLVNRVASRQVVEKAKNKIVQIVVKFIKEADKGDPVAEAVAGGTAIGVAVAEAFAETVTEVRDSQTFVDVYSSGPPVIEGTSTLVRLNLTLKRMTRQH